jgi:Zn-dependent alcohol dehydrogenase
VARRWAQAVHARESPGACATSRDLKDATGAAAPRREPPLGSAIARETGNLSAVRMQILPVTGTIAIDEINQAFERMERGGVRYRFVIDMGSLALV